MLFMIEAILKPGAEEQLVKFHAEFNEHLGPSASGIRLAGVLRDHEGRRAGYLALFEGETIEAATKWVHESPIYQAHLCARLDVYEYEIELGRLAEG